METVQSFNIAVFSGDGIGPEITEPCLDVLRAVEEKIGGFKLTFNSLPAGAELYKNTGEAFPVTSQAQAQSADAILLSAMGLPDVRYPNGTEVSPQIDLRKDLNLFAGIRPVRLQAGLELPLADSRANDIDLVLIRESTEGLFASHGQGIVHGDHTAIDILMITRAVTEQLFDVAFDIARKRKKVGKKGKVTCVDKANVFRSFAFFRKIFEEKAEANSDIEADFCYVDAMALNLVRQPWDYDVIVTENMFGDILSDLGAALMGGMGMAPSSDLGEKNAVFQPCHGSAPDIVGQGKANPTAMFLSAAMMLDWLGDKHNLEACKGAARAIEEAVNTSFKIGDLTPTELGGVAGTKEITDAVLSSLKIQ